MDRRTFLRLSAATLCTSALAGRVASPPRWLERRRPARALVVIVPHVGAAWLDAALATHTLADGGLARLALGAGLVVRHIVAPNPATTSAWLGALLSSRAPHTTGCEMARIPAPHRRHTASAPGLGLAALGAAARLELGELGITCGLPRELVRGLHLVDHQHGRAQTLVLGADEDADALGWHVPDPSPSSAPTRWRATTIEVPIESRDARDRCRFHALLLATPHGRRVVELACAPDARAPRRPRAGRGFVLEAPLACAFAPSERVRAQALALPTAATPAGAARLVVTPFAHRAWHDSRGCVSPIAWPEAPVVAHPLVPTRWEDAERLGIARQAFAAGRAERGLFVLDGASRTTDERALDQLLGELARDLAGLGVALHVLGLSTGHAACASVDLARIVGELAIPALGRVAVHADEGTARLDLDPGSERQVLALDSRLRAALPCPVELTRARRGLIRVQAPPGVALDGLDHARVAGRMPSDPQMDGVLLAYGPGIAREHIARHSWSAARALLPIFRAS